MVSGDDSDRASAGGVAGKLSRVDEFQREHKPLAVAVAVFRKFNDDNSSNLASMIAFWALFSVFPLLLVLVTLLGFLLPADTGDDVLADVARLFPLIDASSVGGLSGSWWALVLGLASALWSGSAAVRVAQFAFNAVWDTPTEERPKLAEQVGRSVGVLAVVGGGLVATTAVTGFVAGAAADLGVGWFGRVAGSLLAVVLDVGLFVVAFRWLTRRAITVRDVLPGALLSGVVFWLLQSLSSAIISGYLHHAQGTYGNFATVITILWWFYLQSLVTLVGAQLNVVLHQRRYPRSLVAGGAT